MLRTVFNVGVLDFHNQLKRNGLRVVQGFGDGLDGCGGNIGSGQPEETRARGSLACLALFPENRSFNTR